MDFLTVLRTSGMKLHDQSISGKRNSVKPERMPILNTKKVEKLPYKIYKAVSKHVRKRKKKAVTGQLVVPLRSKILRRIDKTYETFLRVLVDNLILTNSHGEDGSELYRETHYGIFINSPGLLQNKSITFSHCTNDSKERAFINVGPMPGELKRAGSYDSLLSCGHTHKPISNSKKLLSPVKSRKLKMSGIKSKKYSKYIPVCGNMGEIYSRSDVDSRAPLSWLDVQAWYAGYLDGYENQLRRSRSVDDLILVDSEKLNLDYKSKGKCVNEDKVESNARFGEVNKNYLSINAVSSEQLQQVEEDGNLYIECLVQKDKKLTHDLCEMKTEMISKCLNTFFHPYGENCTSPVRDVTRVVKSRISAGFVDIFGRELDVENVKAIIYLDPAPATLLRHKDLCVLDTVTVSMGITLDQLIIFRSNTLLVE